MRRVSTTIVLALCTLLCVSISSAQQTSTISTTANTSVPNLIRYTGALKDAQGAALTSTIPVGVMFAIYNQQDGGAAVWQETQNVTPDSNGQYSVILGSTTATGLPDDLFSQQEQRWLGVQVQGEAEQARVLLVSVPYAFKAHEADTLGGLPASAFVQAAPTGAASGSAAAGTAVNALGTAGTTASGKTESGKKLPPGPCNPQSGYLTYWDSTGALCASSLFYLNNNIGIGTTTPSTTLEVGGEITADKWYDITVSESPFLSIGWPVANEIAANENTWLGLNAGGQGVSINDTGVNNTFVGNSAGISNTTGKVNTFVGTEAGFSHSTGDTNAFFGYRAGKANGNGNADTFLGYQSGYHNSGNNNTIVGRSAGFDSKGNNNVCVGVSACYSNTASNNSFLGYSAGSANTSGAGNTFLGNAAGSTNITGAGNTYVGNNAGLNNFDSGGGNCCNTIVGDAAGQGGAGNTAAGNSYFGYQAGLVTTTGGKNVFSGYNSGVANTIGSFNSFYGDQSGQNNIGGNDNTFLGISSGGTTFTTGDSNIFVGAFAGNLDNNVSNNIEIGNQGPAPHGSNSILIGTESAGMNQTYIAGIYQQNTLTSALPVVVDATGHLGVGSGSGSGVMGNCTSPAGGTYLSLWGPGSPSTTIGCGLLFQQNTTNFIGVGTTNPSAALDVNGDINAKLDQSSYQINENTVLSAFGDRDTFVGFSATPLNCVNTTGNCEQNTYVGANAGSSNTNGSYNTFFGSAAGNANTTGSSNTFIGQASGIHTIASGNNTFVGEGAGFNNFTGANNAYLGDSTGSNEAGNNNIFLGSNAGVNSVSGNNDIYLGSLACAQVGGCTESNTLRLGIPYSNVFGDCGNLQMPCGQKLVFMEPLLFNPNPSNSGDVVVNVTTGQLGFIGSSRRFKEQIADMGDSSSKLFQLRPVTFFYKPEYSNGNAIRTPQYGLIAEEVAKVYPDLVAYDKDGQPMTVKYQVLAPMLLNELQKQHAVVAAQQEELQTQIQQITAQRQEIDGLKRQLQLQNASLQERLSKLESYVETQMKTASDVQPATTASSNGGSQ
jgi:hypothetical protein